MSRQRRQVPVPVGAPAPEAGLDVARGQAAIAGERSAKPAIEAGPSLLMAKKADDTDARRGEENQKSTQGDQSGRPAARPVPETKARGESLLEPQQTVAPAGEQFRLLGKAPESIFLIDVDRASFTDIRRSLSQNRLPPKDDVRIEELLSEFPSHDVAPLPSNPDPLALHVEIAGCPWDEGHRLARIGVAARPIDQKARAACNFVFLIDVSPSMRRPDRLPIFQWSLNRLVDQLGERDRLAIVVFGPTAGVVLDSTSCLEKSKLQRAIDDLKVAAPDTTRSGLVLAYDIARERLLEHGTNRVIVATDSRFTIEGMSHDDLSALVAEKAAQGISLSLIGVGPAMVNDSTIAKLTEQGRGRHAHASSPARAYRALVEETGSKVSAVAMDAKIQVEFNPDRVIRYRLFGYDFGGAPTEATIDDSQDFGTILEGHRVAALYEIVPPDGLEVAKLGKDRLVEGRGRRLETLKVKLTYKKPDDGQVMLKEQFGFDGTGLARASDDFQVAAAVAGFGLLLRESAAPQGLSYELVQRLIEPYLSEGRDPSGHYHEFAGLVSKAKSISAGARSQQ